MAKRHPVYALLLGLLLWIALISPTWAQEATPVVTSSSFIYFASSEVIYPDAVRFRLVVQRPAVDLATVTLTLRPTGQSPIDIPVNIRESLVFNQQFAELAYIWRIPSDSPPHLFSQVDYRWEVVTNTNETAVQQDHFTYSDLRTDWVQDADPDKRIDLTVPATTDDPKHLRDSVRNVYNLLAANLGQKPALNVMIYTDALPLDPCAATANHVLVAPDSKVEVPCTVGLANTVVRASGYLPLQVAEGRGPVEQVALVQLLVDRFYAPLWGDKVVPAWFRAGLGQFYLPLEKSQQMQVARAAARHDGLYSLDALGTEPPLHTDQHDLWVAQSYGMVLYIADQIGVPGLFGLAKTLGQADSFEAAYQQVVGQPLAALIPGWQNWLFRDVAVSAYGYTPYLANTPTPTVTRTPTPFPPTPTPIPSATDTFTPSATVTGIRTATPLPTRTLPPTPTRGRPTPTPRPPGSIAMFPTDTPSPTPPLAIQLPQNQTVSVLVVAVIFLVLAVLVVVYINMLRRRP